MPRNRTTTDTSGSGAYAYTNIARSTAASRRRNSLPRWLRERSGDAPF